jgi:hypothetical protein
VRGIFGGLFPSFCELRSSLDLRLPSDNEAAGERDDAANTGTSEYSYTKISRREGA